MAIISSATESNANEPEAAPAKAEGEQGDKAAEAAAPSKEKPLCRYNEHESRLMSYTARIRTLEKEIVDMITSKHHIENSEKVKLLTQQILFKHQDLAKVIKEYEQERLHVRFQHPGREIEENRQYSAQRLKSLEEIETSFGLDGRLDRIRKQVGVVFPSLAPKATADRRGPAGIKAVADDDGDEIPTGIKLVK